MLAKHAWSLAHSRTWRRLCYFYVVRPRGRYFFQVNAQHAAWVAYERKVCEKLDDAVRKCAGLLSTCHRERQAGLLKTCHRERQAGQLQRQADRTIIQRGPRHSQSDLFDFFLLRGRRMLVHAFRQHCIPLRVAARSSELSQASPRRVCAWTTSHTLTWPTCASAATTATPRARWPSSARAGPVDARAFHSARHPLPFHITGDVPPLPFHITGDVPPSRFTSQGMSLPPVS